MSLSLKNRWEIVFLSTHLHGPHWSNKKIAKFLNFSPHTVKHWLQTYQESGDVQDRERSGRPSSFTEGVDNKIIAQIEANPETSSEVISEKLKAKGVPTSSRSVRGRMNMLGLKSGNPLSTVAECSTQEATAKMGSECSRL